MNLEEITANQSEIADLLGISQTAVSKWDLEQVEGEGPGKFHRLKDAVQKKIQILEGQIRNQDEGLTKAKTARENIMTQKTALEVGKMQDELLPAAEVIQVWSEYVTFVRGQLLALPETLWRKVNGKRGRAEIKPIIEKEIFKALVDLQKVDLNVFLDPSER